MRCVTSKLKDHRPQMSTEKDARRIQCETIFVLLTDSTAASNLRERIVQLHKFVFSCDICVDMLFLGCAIHTGANCSETVFVRTSFLKLPCRLWKYAPYCVALSILTCDAFVTFCKIDLGSQDEDPPHALRIHLAKRQGTSVLCCSAEDLHFFPVLYALHPHDPDSFQFLV